MQTENLPTAALLYRITQVTHHKLQVNCAALHSLWYNLHSPNWSSVLQGSTLTRNLHSANWKSPVMRWNVYNVTCTVQTAKHNCCGAVMHNATSTLQFAHRQCCIAMPYHSTNCKSPLLHWGNILLKWNEILIPAVSLLQSGLTAGDVFNVRM